MRLRHLPLLAIFIMLVSAPAFADTTAAQADIHALKTEVTDLFADAALREYLQGAGAEVRTWLEQMQVCVQNPDARLFYLTGLLLFDYGNDAWSDWPEVGAQLMLDGMVADSQFNEFTLALNDDGTALACADFSPDWNHIWRVTYFTRKAPDGSLWCLETQTADDRYASTVDTRIMRFHEGKIYLLTPTLPRNEDFYAANPDTFGPPVHFSTEALAEWNDTLDDCEMQAYFAADTTAAPFSIKAVLYQINPSHYAPAYRCVPQCYIEYAWNGAQYVRSAKICLENDSAWGLSLPDN